MPSSQSESPPGSSDSDTTPANDASGTFYVTTPIYYVNDRPHLGHAYTTIAADAIARWHRRAGREVVFLTGTDEHGDKVQRAAAARGLTPQEHVDDMVQPFQALWERLEVRTDDFIRTTEPRHQRVVQAVLQHLHDRGDLYVADYEGWYSTAAERFWTEKDLVDGKCPDTGQSVEWISERNWYFKMAKYADRLRTWVEENPGFVRPESRRNEVLGYLRKDVGDLCISRPKSRLSWGIPLPFDPEFVTYVWFDALLNYISAIGYHPDAAQCSARFHKFWPANVHLVGKDILTTHSVYWSTMLFALGLPPADCLYAHGWWTVEGRKMSKSIGNVVDPNLLVDAYGADAVRYFVLREIAFGTDGDFSHKGFMTRYNADLANDLGNLAHRSLSMTEKWLDSRVPALDPDTESDVALSTLAADTVARFRAEIEGLQFHAALDALWELVRAGNKYIDTQEPWALNRTGNRPRLAGVMRRTLEICRVAAELLAPIMPSKAAELGGKLGVDALAAVPSGRLDQLATNTDVAAGTPLFPRMTELPEAIQQALEAALGSDTATEKPEPVAKAAHEPARTDDTRRTAMPEASTPKTAPPVTPETPSTIAYDDFAKVQLRVGIVNAAEPHPNADKLLVLSVDIGEAQPRTIVAGIRSRYAPEDLVGRRVVVVANLKPAKLRGIRSEGMLLAAGEAAVEGLVTLLEDVPPGTVVR